MHKPLNDPLPWGPDLHARTSNSDCPACDLHQGKMLDYRLPQCGKSVPEFSSVQNSNAAARSNPKGCPSGNLAVLSGTRAERATAFETARKEHATCDGRDA